LTIYDNALHAYHFLLTAGKFTDFEIFQTFYLEIKLIVTQDTN